MGSPHGGSEIPLAPRTQSGPPLRSCRLTRGSALASDEKPRLVPPTAGPSHHQADGEPTDDADKDTYEDRSGGEYDEESGRNPQRPGHPHSRGSTAVRRRLGAALPSTTVVSTTQPYQISTVSDAQPPVRAPPRERVFAQTMRTPPSRMLPDSRQESGRIPQPRPPTHPSTHSRGHPAACLRFGAMHGTRRDKRTVKMRWTVESAADGPSPTHQRVHKPNHLMSHIATDRRPFWPVEVRRDGVDAAVIRQCVEDKQSKEEAAAAANHEMGRGE
ncbi:hypothetical protein JB92DRAFT_2889886 [Gautieria morchelliformis]|nr:hypothetical protein JB92DRAFT_2889886 [Gautieria morchelliformis]